MIIIIVLLLCHTEVWEERPVVLAPSPKDFYINNEFQRKQRAQHGSKV